MPELSTLGATIKIAYEGESNTNAFTDPEQTKLANIDLISPDAGNDLTANPKFWVGSQVEYDAIAVKDGNTLYFVVV